MHDVLAVPESVLSQVMEEGARAWDEFRARTSHRHHLFIPCDHAEAYAVLRELRGEATSFLELGSAAGVVTILADLLGFEAAGIEIEPWLVERSRQLAESVDSSAIFAEGTFVPVDYQDEVELLSADFLTLTDGASAYDELGLELADFDVVFAYPWPGEEAWFETMLARYARPDATFLTYDAKEGFRITRAAD